MNYLFSILLLSSSFAVTELLVCVPTFNLNLGETTLLVELNENELQIWDAKTKQFRLYPNPATDHIVVERLSLAEESTKIEVFNPSGKKVRSYLLAKDELSVRFDLSDLEVGSYFVTLKLSGRETHILKFIKV